MALDRQEARQLKRKAVLKFKRLEALNAQGAEGRQAKRKLSESWHNRGGSNTAGFYDAKTAREVKRGFVSMYTGARV